MSNNSFDARDFRRALAQFPTGVTVITTLDQEGNPVGVTASSFNSVSIDPPLILWSIDKGSHSLEAFEKAEHFVVNVLNRDQVADSNNFARRGEDKFANANYHPAIGDCPALDDFAAQFECSTWAVYEGGDHLILVGEVKSYKYKDGAEPLVFARGSYAISAQHPAMAQTEAAEEPAEESDFVSEYLLYLLRVGYQGFGKKLYPELKQQHNVTPEEWRILARMVNRNSIQLEDLSEMVMQPVVALRQTADRLVEQGNLEYLNEETLQITTQGANVASKIQTLATELEADLLSQLSAEHAETLKSGLKALIEKLS